MSLEINLAELVPTEAQQRYIERAYRQELAALRAEHRCPHCGLTYTLWASLGRLECWQHPGQLFRAFPSNERRWSCCGRPAARSVAAIDGCCPADHLLPSATAHHVRSLRSAAILPLPVFLLLPERKERAFLDVILPANSAQTLFQEYNLDKLRDVKHQHTNEPVADADALVPDAYYTLVAEQRERLDSVLAYDHQTNLSQFVVVVNQISDAPVRAATF